MCQTIAGGAGGGAGGAHAASRAVELNNADPAGMAAGSIRNSSGLSRLMYFGLMSVHLVSQKHFAHGWDVPLMITPFGQNSTATSALHKSQHSSMERGGPPSGRKITSL